MNKKKRKKRKNKSIKKCRNISYMNNIYEYCFKRYFFLIFLKLLFFRCIDLDFFALF